MAVEHLCQRHGRPAVASGSGSSGRDTGNRVPLRARSRRRADVEPPRRRQSVRRVLLRLLRPGAVRRARGRRHAARRARWNRSTSPSSSATPRASCCNARRRRRSSGEAWTSTPSICCAPPCRTTSSRHVVRAGRRRSAGDRRPGRGRGREGGRTDVAPSLSPDAKAALLAAYDETRELGASYLGPEHVLLALARDDEVGGRAAARALRPLAHEAARRRDPRRRDRGGGRPRRARRQTLDEYGRDLTAGGARGQARPGDRPGGRDRADDRDPLPADQEQPRADRRARRRQDRDRRRASRSASSTTTCPRRSPASASIALDLAGAGGRHASTAASSRSG